MKQTKSEDEKVTQSQIARKKERWGFEKAPVTMKFILYDHKKVGE